MKNSYSSKALKSIPSPQGKQKEFVNASTEDQKLLILGVAGSGKSTTVMNRVIHIWENDPKDKKNILVITYNKTLRDSFVRDLEREFDGDVINSVSFVSNASGVTITNYDSFIYRFIDRAFKRLITIRNEYLKNGKFESKVIEEQYRRSLRLLDEFLEYRDNPIRDEKYEGLAVDNTLLINAARDVVFGSINELVKDKKLDESFLGEKAERIFQSIRLMLRSNLVTKKKIGVYRDKKYIDLEFDDDTLLLVLSKYISLRERWPVIWSSLDDDPNYKPEKKHKWDLDELLGLFSFMVENGDFKFYDHILLDEAQDMPENLITSLDQMLKPHGCIYLFADEIQKIYKNLYFPLTGILRYTDRPWILDQNFRNKREIALYSNHLLNNFLKNESSLFIQPNIPLPKSAKPLHVRFHKNLVRMHPNVEMKYLFDTIIKEAADSNKVAILVENWGMINVVADFLKKEGFFDFCILNSKDYLDCIHQNVYISTIHSAKGLEFDYIILPFQGTHRQSFETKKNKRDILDHDKAIILPSLSESQTTQLAKLLYVACTRSKEYLVVSYMESPNTIISSIPRELITEKVIEYDWNQPTHDSVGFEL